VVLGAGGTTQNVGGNLATVTGRLDRFQTVDAFLSLVLNWSCDPGVTSIVRRFEFRIGSSRPAQIEGRQLKRFEHGFDLPGVKAFSSAFG
jgi:hypothetical protein